MITNVTLKESNFHIWDDWGRPNDQSLHSNQFVNIGRIKLTHSSLILDVERPHFVDVGFDLINKLILRVCIGRIVQGQRNHTILDGLIHDRNDFLWIID
ncbi:hypothetical protein OGAPHI_007023 [Ogataea philodendri]|uniref:Uncharacterized protein n=1 Tax=Ogataea philodendri TaxID=1378263 RepID=A0A9P8NVK6_9ASCO|nr:uncharacterized protein OGAPHI_007023 [Ogataea philodendri]KAH3660437.1 hypothetical protein OGAPHI_007023 [Ogataea philodendri]